MKLWIYGVSDDLIEVEGDIREEFTLPSEGVAYLAVSDGTVLRITYSGMWHIERIIAGTAEYMRNPATDIEDNYSDSVTLEGHPALIWVVFGDRLERKT